MLKLADSVKGDVLYFPNDARLAVKMADSGVYDLVVTGEQGCKVGHFDPASFSSSSGLSYLEKAVERLNALVSESASVGRDTVFLLPSDVICAMDLEIALSDSAGRDSREKASVHDI